MLCGCVAFAFMSLFASVLGLQYHCDWRVIALFRSGLATVFALALCLQGRAPLVVFRPRILWLRSFAGSASLCCTFYALTHLPVAEVLVLTYTFPIWVALLSWPLTREVPDRSAWLSALAGVMGVVVIQQPHDGGDYVAALFALIAALATSVAMLGLHRLHGVDPRAIVVHFSAVSTLFIVAALCFVKTPAHAELVPDGVALLLLCGVGLTATVGQVFLTMAFASGPPAKVSVVGLTQILFVMALEQLWAPRSYDVTTLAGMVLVLAPTGWVLWHSRRPSQIAVNLDEAHSEHAPLKALLPVIGGPAPQSIRPGPETGMTSPSPITGPQAVPEQGS
jgi:drug/metabolite transporter (DMT)-like permease